MCGVWPTTAFALLPVEEQRAFMAQLDGKSSTEISSILETLEGKEDVLVELSLLRVPLICMQHHATPNSG
jgi:hypothetical protein